MRIAVLGAGVVGVTTAYSLARDGHEVTVVERHDAPAGESSFANACLVAPGHAYAWSSPEAPRLLLRSLVKRDQSMRLKLRASPHMWRWLLKFLAQCTEERARINTGTKLRLCLYSQQVLHEVVADTGVRYDARRKGLLYVYRDPRTLDAEVQHMAVLAHGQELNVVDPKRAAEIDPTLESVRHELAGAIYAPGDESGDSRMFSEGLAAHCRAALGVTFRFGTRITGFRVAGNAVQTTVTDQGEVAADAFVLALGTESPRLGRKLGLDLPIYPVKGYSVTLPVDERHRPPTIGGVDGDSLFAYCPLDGRLRLTATAEISGYDRSHRPADFRALLRSARRLLPEGGDYERPTFWACLRPMTPEGAPMMGAARYRNLFLNTGHGHMGWTMACGSARIVADLIAGRTPAIDMEGLEPR
jgi:D-amino-acid dehydrogenase